MDKKEKTLSVKTLSVKTLSVKIYVKQTFDIEEELLHEFRVLAVQQRRRQKEIVNELLREYVYKKKRKNKISL